MAEEGQQVAIVDDRRTVRVFLASSHSLPEERAQFPEMLARVEKEREDVRRRFRLVSVRWDRNASGAAADDIDGSIRESVDFDDMDVVVVLIGDRIGEGTRGEYERALEVRRQHTRPQLLVYARRPTAGASPEDRAAIARFIREAHARGVITTPYDDVADLSDLLAEHLPRWLPTPRAYDAGPPLVLRRRFLQAASLNVALAVAATALCRWMRFPDFGVSERSILLVLGAPVFLLLTGWATSFSYSRLLSALRGLWHSKEWTTHAHYESFRSVVPRFVLPARAARHFPGHPLVTLGLVALGLLANVVGQYNCVFEEILVWDYAVGWGGEKTDVAPAAFDAKECPKATFVDRGRRWWPPGLQDARARAQCDCERRQEKRWHCVIYVYAPAGFSAPPGQPFRADLGPEVWLTLHGWGYLVIFAASVALGLGPLITLARLKRQLAGGLE